MKYLLLSASLLVSFLAVQAQSVTGDALGTVIDSDTKQPMEFVRAIIKDQGKKYQALTDKDGRFRISAIPAGTYELFLVFGPDTSKKYSVEVPIESYANIGTVDFKPFGVSKDEVVVKERLRLRMGELPMPELTHKEIEHNPNKFSIATMATQLSSEVKMDEDGQLMFRGARKGDMTYVVDGVKLPEVYNVPSCAINRMMVYTGGLPAKYGDTLGGAIVVETYGYFDLLRERN
ncbi:MAG: carboxypeptidase regulatory-like domain-containing protein [Bacteroidota bacterium]